MADIKFTTKVPVGSRRRQSAQPAGVLDLRSEAELERRRERARALAKQAAGMQAARAAGRPAGSPAADGLTRQERAARRQAAAKAEAAEAVTPDRSAPAVSPVVDHRPDGAEPQASARVADMTQSTVPVGKPKAAVNAEPTSKSHNAKSSLKRPAAATRPDGARTKGIGRKVLGLAQYPLIAVVALAAAYSATVGQWLILAYAIFALIRRLDSRYSFGAALFLLVTIPLFSALGQSGIAQTAAIYVYELLVVGTIQAVIELRKSGISSS